MGSKSIFGAILGGFGAPNRFLVQSSAGFGPQIGFWRNPRRVWGFKLVFGAILGGFRTPNRFLAQSSAGFGPRIGFWCNPRRVWGFKSIFGVKPGGFCGVRVGANCIRPIRRPPRGRMNASGIRPCRDVWGANAIRPYTGTRQTSLPRQRPIPRAHSASRRAARYGRHRRP